LLLSLHFLAPLVSAAVEDVALPSQDEVFTVAFDLHGRLKESKTILSSDEFIHLMQRGAYIGKLNLQLKFPLADNYWVQEGVVVLKTKQVFAFSIYQDMESSDMFLAVFSGTGYGVDLYRLPTL